MEALVSTFDDEMERYREPYTGPVPENLSVPSESNVELSRLLTEVVEARKALQLSQRYLAVLEQSLGGRKSTQS